MQVLSMWWTGMGFSLVNCFLGKSDFVLQHISSWQISVKWINIRLCFSRVYAVYQKRASVDYFNINKIMSSSLGSHFSFCTWANLPFRTTFFLILTFPSYPSQAKMPDSIVSWWNLFLPASGKHCPQYSCQCSGNMKDTFSHWNKLALYRLLGKALCRWSWVWPLCSCRSLFVVLIVYTMCLSWHHFWKGCCCAAVHSVSIHGVNDCCQSDGKELSLAWRQCAPHAQSGSGPTYWDVFSSVGHVNCSVAGTQTFMHAEQRASHPGK